MPAYVIASVRSADGDPQALAEYRERNTRAVANHGGEFLVRGGPHAVLEGSWDPLRLVLIAFPDAAAARAWFDSDEYQPLKALRRSASETDVLLVEGV